jgi:lipoprotein-anchoring transpeptidase ErfK/SrfK
MEKIAPPGADMAAAPPAPPIPAPIGSAVSPGPQMESPQDPQAVTINTAAWDAPPTQGLNPAILRAQVLLARAHFSPGVIDGRDGANFRQALASYEAAHQLPADGRLDAKGGDILTQADAGPAITSYVITAADVAGPSTATIPKDDYRAMSKLPALDYTSPLERLAERFQMDEGLLVSLNPEVDFKTAGARILVAATARRPLSGAVATIEVDKAKRQVRALDAAGAVLAVYPATVGSSERPAPSGDYAVKGVATDPVYTYDPKRLTFGDRSMGKLTIKPGPNNPVGAAWIDLNIPTYGIHGAPDPRLVGKVASHGCVRLTNWDVEELAAAVKAGVKVVFVGKESAA